MGVARIVLGNANGRIAKLPVNCESGVDSQRRWNVDAIRRRRYRCSEKITHHASSRKYWHLRATKNVLVLG